MLVGFIAVAAVIPLLVFVGIVLGIWAILSSISNRNSRALDRLARLSRPPSLGGHRRPEAENQQLPGPGGHREMFASPMMPKTELEQNALKTKLANAGFRSDAATMVYSGARFGSLLLFSLVSVIIFIPGQGLCWSSGQWIVIFTGVGFYLPSIILWWLRAKRQEAIFLTLPDALDLLVVCVEAGLGLDAAMRKVCDEMSEHAKVMCEELSLANFQLQMGRPRREVLHDLGVRTGVDDVRALAAILIQADRFGSSIAHAFRVQSDRCGRAAEQLAEEKAAKTAVQLLSPVDPVHLPWHLRGAGGAGGDQHHGNHVQVTCHGVAADARAGGRPSRRGGRLLLEEGGMKGIICAVGGDPEFWPAVSALFAGCQCYRNLVDPCWPERYNAVARQSVVETFAGQVGNGHVLNQTVWNYHFETGTDKLTPGGLERLAYLTRVRPAPDPKLFLQTAHDIPAYNPAGPEKYEQARADLDAKRRVAVLKFLGAETAGRPVPFIVDVIDAPVPGLAAPPAATIIQKHYLNFQGMLSGFGGNISGGSSSGGGGGGTGTGGR